jgi:hypothetical protein
MTSDSELAQNSQRISSKPHTFRIFKAGVGVTRIVSAAGYDRSKLPVVETEEAI